MNNEFNNINISKGGLIDAILPFSNDIKADLLNCRLAFVVYREHSPTNFHSDYIENKTTLVEAEKSTIQNFIIKSLNKCMQYLADNIRPHVIFNSATNLIKSLY